MAEREAEKPPEKAAKAEEGKRGYIQYIGLATAKGIKHEDWEAAGVTGQREVWWTRANGYRVWRSELSDEAYNIAIRPDPQMILIGGDPEEGSFASHPMADNPPAAQSQEMPDRALYGK